jgi:hypothetical protein
LNVIRNSFSWGGLGVAFQRLAVACFVSYLFLRSTASSFWSVENRFFLHWQRADAFGVLGAILLTGAVLYLGWALASRCGKPGRWLRDAFLVMFFLQYARVNIAEMWLASGVGGTGLGLHVLKIVHLLVLLGFLVFRERVLCGVRNTCLLLSPILLVYASTLLLARPYQQIARNRHDLAERDQQARTLAAPPRRVVLIVFDEWSYDRVFEADGSVKNGYPALAEAAAQATVYRLAYAPASSTLQSLPAILAGVQQPGQIDRKGHYVVRTDAGIFPYAGTETMLTDAAGMGGRTALIGNYLPYADLVGHDADLCVAFDLYRVAGTSPLALSMSLVLENLRIRFSFIHPAMGWPFHVMKHRYFARMAETIQELTLAQMDDPSAGFVFVHHSVPHMPFIFDREGPRQGLHQPATLDLADYEGNLRYTDQLIGQLLQAFHARPDGEELLLILTADHAFRADPALKKLSGEVQQMAMRHVPLLLLQKGQARPSIIEEPFDLVDLRRLIAEWRVGGRGTLDFKP